MKLELDLPVGYQNVVYDPAQLTDPESYGAICVPRLGERILCRPVPVNGNFGPRVPLLVVRVEYDYENGIVTVTAE
jgi:hypothetical protein